MAKRAVLTGRRGRNSAEEKIVHYAEDLGHFLGSVRARITTYNSERRQLVKHLSALVADAQHLLTELGHSAAVAVRRRGRPAGSKAAGSKSGAGRLEKTGRKRRKLSAAAREKIRQAQLKRWAKVRAAAAK